MSWLELRVTTFAGSVFGDTVKVIERTASHGGAYTYGGKVIDKAGSPIKYIWSRIPLVKGVRETS